MCSASQSVLCQTETEYSIESASGAVNESSSHTCDALLDSNLTVEEIDEWISTDVDAPGHQILSDEDTVLKSHQLPGNNAKMIQMVI